MVARQGHLGGPGEIEVIGLEAVDLVGMDVQVSRAGHDVRPHQRRGDHRGESVLDSLGDRHVEQGQLKAGTDALEEVEARAADLGAPRHVEGIQAFGELEVVLGLEAFRREISCRTNGFQDRVVVLTTAGDALNDDVGDAADQRLELAISGVGRGLQLLHPVRGGLGRSHQCRLLLALRGGDLLAERLLFGAQRLELGDGRPSSFVCRQDRVDDPLVLATGTLRGPDGVGLVAQELDVNHGPSLSATAARPRTCRRTPHRHVGSPAEARLASAQPRTS